MKRRTKAKREARAKRAERMLGKYLLRYKGPANMFDNPTIARAVKRHDRALSLRLHSKPRRPPGVR